MLACRNAPGPLRECRIVDRFYHERLRAEDDLSRHLRSGALKPVDNVVEGFDNLPRAVVGLCMAAHSGKLQVRCDPGRAGTMGRSK
jgi:NADPH-dependent curcumin reductase CurA